MTWEETSLPHVGKQLGDGDSISDNVHMDDICRNQERGADIFRSETRESAL